MKKKQPYYGLLKQLSILDMTQGDAAQLIGMARGTFNSKVNRRDGRDFTYSEALELAKKLKIGTESFF